MENKSKTVGKVKMFEYNGEIVSLVITNVEFKTLTISRYVGKYEKSSKRVLETNSVEVVNDYLKQLRNCNVSYNCNYIKVVNGHPTKKELSFRGQ